MSTGCSHIISKIESSVKQVSSTVETHLSNVDYEELSSEDQVRHDLFLAYSLNSLLWMYLRMNGIDPSKTVIKTELSRIKELMSELQRNIDRNTIMPRVDQAAAKRFIKHGLGGVKNDEEEPKPKHVRFSES